MVRGFALVVCVGALCVASAADARVLHGVVFADRNGDGAQGSDEPGVPGAIVAYDVTTFVTADATGQFDLVVPDGATGNAWVRVPDGYAPGPVWAPVATTTSLAFGVRPVTPAPGPLTFVVASDSHITAAQPFFDDLAGTAARATALSPRPAFFAITGDVTQGDADGDFDLMDQQTAQLGVPFVPVPGNHDWYDGGATWHRRYGPDNYSFDVQGVHFVVWNMSMSDASIQAYLGAELSHVDPAMTVVALSHAPPAPSTIATLRGLGVDYVLTGHTHTNRVIDHGGLLELNTQPFLMGGLDFTPAGYRVVTLAGGKLRSYHRTVVDQPFLQVVGPAIGQCVSPDGGDLLAAAEIDASALVVTARIDHGPEAPLTAAGGWAFRGPLPPLAAGIHAIELTARAASGTTTTQLASFTVCDLDVPPPPATDWAQLGGGADHQNATSSPLAPPLVPRWSQPVGGHVLQAAPVIAGGVVYATATDLGDDTTGGVVAFDLATGATLWRTPAHARGGPAVVGDVVVVAQIDGSVLGLARATGAVLWTAPLGADLRSEAAFISAAPAADGGEIFVGNEHHFAALEAATGAPSWMADPSSKDYDFSTDDSMAIGGGLVIGSFTRSTGVSAWDRDTGDLVWQVVDDATTGVNGSPVIAGDTVYLVDAADDALALELGTGKTRWKTSLDPAGFVWGNATAGAPAIAAGVLVVPTLYGDLVGLDATSGAVRWRHATAPSVLRTTHYRGNGMAGYEGSPVIADGVVWAADTAGELVALDLQTGGELWRTSVGAPVLASLAVADGWLVVASYDGTIHALSRPFVADAAGAGGGCCDARGGGPGSAALLTVVAIALGRRRSRASRTARPRSGT